MSRDRHISNQAITIQELLRAFSVLKYVSGGRDSLKRKIFSGVILQPGLELSGFFLEQYREQVILFTSREREFIERNIKEGRIHKVFDDIFKWGPPCIIFDHDFKCPKFVVELSKKYGVPVCQVQPNHPSFAYHLQNFLAQTFVPYTEMHASCLSVFGCGVLLIGESGVGKSEVAIELVKKKHLFICDDRAILKRVGWDIRATSPSVIKNLVEVRGIGILDVKHMFGVQACLDNVKVDLIIRLLSLGSKKGEVERLGTNSRHTNVLGVPITTFELPVRHGRTMSELVETSVIGYLLRQDGVDTTKEINKRIKEEQMKGDPS